MSNTKETIGPRGTVAGFRPLIGEERWLFEDYKQRHLAGGKRPLLYGENGVTHGMLYPVTKRPLPPPQVKTFEYNGHVWYRHIPGNERPVEPETLVVVILKKDEDDVSRRYSPDFLLAEDWDWSNDNDDLNIVGYRFPDYPLVRTNLQKQQAFAEPVEKTEQSFQQRLSDEDARDVSLLRYLRDEKPEMIDVFGWDAAWQAAKLHYTAGCHSQTADSAEK